MYVVPKEGLSVRDPDLLDLLPQEGRLVPATDYWIRRVHDGDVVETGAAAAAVVEATNTDGSEQQ